LAAAKVLNSRTCQEGPFLFHPAATDACFQLGIVAMAKRAGHNFKQLCVPTMIEELDVSRKSLEMSAQAWMSADVFWYRLSMGPIVDELLGILPIFEPEVLLPRELSIYPEPLLFHLLSRVPSPTSHIQSPLSYISGCSLTFK
jgi:hypothetical protein